MSTQGPNALASWSDDSAVGTVAWGGVTNAAADDGTRASAGLIGETSHYLKGLNPGWSPAITGTVDGIEVVVQRSKFGAGSVFSDSTIKLVKAGSAVGNNKAIGTAWPITDTDQSYGGASDLWGTTWTPAEVNASDFGVAISVSETDGLFSGLARVDYVTITITYTPAGTDPPIGMTQKSRVPVHRAAAI